jgi:hypothetical protein
LVEVVATMGATLGVNPFPLDPFSDGRGSDHGSGSR